MPRKKHLKCSTIGCIDIRADKWPNKAKCSKCGKAILRARYKKNKYGHKNVTFSPGIDKFRSKTPI